MGINRKLTKLLQGRVIKNAEASPTEFGIHFADGSAMKIRMSETIILKIPKGVRIRKIQEGKADFVIECDDGAVIDIQLSEPGNSVSLRDRHNHLEYTG